MFPVKLFVFSYAADNTVSSWSLCILHPCLHIYMYVYTFIYINKLGNIYISVQNKSKPQLPKCIHLPVDLVW